MDRRRTDRRKEIGQDIAIPDLMGILQIIYRRKRVVLPIVLIPMIATLFFLKFKADTYKATASVLLEDQEVNMSDFQDVVSGMQFDNMTAPTQISVIQSPTLIRHTINSLNISTDPNGNMALLPDAMPDSTNTQPSDTEIDYGIFKHFTENLEVKQQGTSRVIEISFYSKDPTVAARIANAHAEQYVMSQINIKKIQAGKLQDWISKQIIQLKQESLRKSDAVQKFRVESGMVLGRNDQELVYQQISDIAAQLTPTQTRMLDLKARNDLLTTGDTQSITEVVDSNLIQDLKGRLSDTSQKLESLRTDYGGNHPSVIAAQQEIKQIQRDIQTEIGNIRKAIKNELTTVEKQKEMLEEKLTELQKQADSFQEKQGTLQALQLEEAASKKLLDSFLARSEEISSQVDFTRPDVRIVSMADVPGEPVASKKPIIFIAATLLSLMIALTIVFLLEVIDSGIQTKEDIKKLYNIKLLGTLPIERYPIKKVLDKDRSVYLEEIKRIYIHLNTTPEIKTLLFTSARKGEGKSSVVISLAYYLTSIGKKTLVIDADTLDPTIAGITQIKNDVGLYELLAGTCGLKDVLVKDRYGISILPSGEQNPYVSDLLLSGRLQPHLAVLEKAYDYILIDSAAALDISDTEILSALVDQVVLVTAWAKTPRKKIGEAVEVIKQFSKNVPSVILNKMDVSKI